MRVVTVTFPRNFNKPLPQPRIAANRGARLTKEGVDIANVYSYAVEAVVSH